MTIYALIYIAAVSIFAVVLTIRDKSAARRKAWRIKERTLFAAAILGGSAAMLLTMYLVRHKTRHKKFMLGIPLILLAQILLIVFVFDAGLSVGYYSQESDKVGEEITLILLADLHACHYGEGQEELILAIDRERPDAVLLCGDLFDDDMPPENATRLVADITEKYPCYYVSGNHEFWSGEADEFKASLEGYGVKVLEGTSDLLEIGGETIRIGGIDDPTTDDYRGRSPAYTEQIKRLTTDFADDGPFTILMSHRPERISELLPLGPDLVVSGHAHGGQWRLPLLLENGFLAPNQGFFPQYTNGAYSFDKTTLLVSRGLARESTRLIPRIFNRPELVVITVT